MGLCSRGWFLECDGIGSEDCAEQFDPAMGDEVTEADDVLTEAREAGWSFEYGGRNSLVRTVCPSCVKAEASAPAGKRKRPGVEVGCGLGTCEHCYEDAPTLADPRRV